MVPVWSALGWGWQRRELPQPPPGRPENPALPLGAPSLRAGTAGRTETGLRRGTESVSVAGGPSEITRQRRPVRAGAVSLWQACRFPWRLF